jgi:hypothetical protein
MEGSGASGSTRYCWNVGATISMTSEGLIDASGSTSTT